MYLRENIMDGNHTSNSHMYFFTWTCTYYSTLFLCKFSCFSLFNLGNSCSRLWAQSTTSPMSFDFFKAIIEINFNCFNHLCESCTITRIHLHIKNFIVYNSMPRQVICILTNQNLTNLTARTQITNTYLPSEISRALLTAMVIPATC